MKPSYQKAADLLKALAHPVRLKIIETLIAGECPVCQLQISVGCRQSAVSQHLCVLRQAGLVERRREGLYAYYRLPDTALLQALLEALNLPLRSAPHPLRTQNSPVWLSELSKG